jgi:hypothetical protein
MSSFIPATKKSNLHLAKTLAPIVRVPSSFGAPLINYKVCRCRYGMLVSMSILVPIPMLVPFLKSLNYHIYAFFILATLYLSILAVNCPNLQRACEAYRFLPAVCYIPKLRTPPACRLRASAFFTAPGFNNLIIPRYPWLDPGVATTVLKHSMIK